MKQEMVLKLSNGNDVTVIWDCWQNILDAIGEEKVVSMKITGERTTKTTKEYSVYDQR